MMKKLYCHSIRYKIVIYSALCVISISICGNLFLYKYLNNIIIQKADNLNQIYLNTITEQMEVRFQDLLDIGINCSSQKEIIRAMELVNAELPKEKKILMQAQAMMNTFINSTTLTTYINKIIILNESGLAVQGVARHPGYPEDMGKVMDRIDKSKDRVKNREVKFQLGSSITPYEKAPCYWLLLKIDEISESVGKAYLYLEVSNNLVKDILKPYEDIDYLVIWNEEDITMMIENYPLELRDNLLVKQEEEIYELRDQRFQLRKQEVNYTNTFLYHYSDITDISLGERDIKYTLFWVLVLTIVVALGLIVIVSKWITKPIMRIIERIKKISQNDFSFDPAIEESKDEIGEIGRVINEMVQSVANLMRETIRINEEKNNIEMAMLQAQVNPHFLYNTLDSIHWMAVIQKAPGISSITKSLSNLLRNMAKGFSDKIPLAEEVRLLEDYITIQSIRYAEIFGFENRISEEFYKYSIIKLTLQPVVENAIFHGIEPAGKLGKITLDAYEDEYYIYLVVGDNGVGMTEDQKTKLLSEDKEKTSNTMSGIGVSNVNRRLKLFYGKQCGLYVESEPDKFTKITIQIWKETL